MASFFSPPVRLIGATTLADPHPGNALWRNYPANRVGINVYLMPGNVLTEAEPYSDLEAVRVFHGGHIHPIDDAELALLIAAGYGDNILTAGIPAVSPGIDQATPDDGGAVVDAAPPAEVVGDVYVDVYVDTYGGSITDTVDPPDPVEPTDPPVTGVALYDTAIYDTSVYG